MKVTEDELVLAAHYGFTKRLSEVVAATLSYQRDKRAHDRRLDDAERTGRVLETAQRLEDRLPAELGLCELASEQDSLAQRELQRAAGRLRCSAERFFDVAGSAATDLIAAIETHEYELDRPRLLSALRTRVRSDPSGAPPAELL